RARQRFSCRADGMLCGAPCIARVAFGLGALTRRAFCFCQALLEGADLLRCLCGGRIQFRKAILLRQPQSSRSRRVRASYKTVPAPQVAIPGNQTLAGRKQLLQAWTVSGIDNADLRQAASKLRRRTHHRGEANHAFRQGRIVGVRFAVTPMDGRAAVKRYVEIFSQRRSQSRLEAAIDTDLFHNRRKLAATRGSIQHVCEGTRLRLDTRKFCLRLLQRRTRRGFGRPRLPDRLFSGYGGGIGSSELGFRFLHQCALLCGIWQFGEPRGNLSRFTVHISELPGKPVTPLDSLAQRALELVALGSRLRALGGQCCQRLLAERQRSCGALEGSVLGCFPLGGSCVFRIQLAFFLGQTLQNVGIVAHHALLARYVRVELFEPTVKLGLAGAYAACLLLDLGLCDRKALNGSRGRSFGLAQFRQAVGAYGLLLGRVHLGSSALANQRRGSRQGGSCLCLLLLG